MSMNLGEATITPGTISGDVRTIQQILTGQGYNVGPIDGNFGPQTLAAVQAFQKTKGLVPDGVVGPLTWDALHGKTPEPVLAPQPAPVPPSPRKDGVMTALTVGAVVMAAAILSSPRRRR